MPRIGPWTMIRTIPTVEAHAKKHPARLNGTLFGGVDGFTMDNGKRDVTTPKISGRPGVSGLGFLWK
eukprot:7928251-Pyramimonas_sp.AAC.1